MTFEKFKDEFISCFQEHIIDAGVETYVESINPDIIMTSHGHGISFNLKNVSFGPIIALEGLISATRDMTMKQVAERVNQDVTKFYQMNISISNVDTLEPDRNVILTAMPTNTLNKNYALNEIEYSKDNTLGLTVFIKTRIPNANIQGAEPYAHIRQLEPDEKCQFWSMATINTLNRANIMVEEHNVKQSNMPVLMHITDTNQFADYFYLLYKIVLIELSQKRNIKYFTIFPDSPYHASVMGVPKRTSLDIEKDFLKNCLYPMILDYYKKENHLPVFKFDVTKEIFSIQTIYIF